ncbi:MAG: cation transporter [Erysipelotrichaceae bacterium]|nr:cation transporter [Erysipelotrichaceae bacterium]
MNVLYKWLKQDPENRDSVIQMTSGLGIVVNVLIAATKVIVGLLSSSIAIVSEGVNNASDALTAILTLVGSKLAGKHPDEKHPFGYGRVEYLTNLVIAILILITGVEMLQSSVQLVFHPEELQVSYVSLIIVAASAVIKYLLGAYTKKMGKSVNAPTLEALGADSQNDSFVSVVTIGSTLVFLLTSVSIDAYAGIVMSGVILKTGIEVLKNTVSELLGRPGDEQLAKELYRKIRSTEGILGAADMMLHNYGPQAYSGSVNVEIDHEKTVGEIYQVIHQLQLDIMNEYHVTMVFGLYAVGNDHDGVNEIRRSIAKYVREKENVRSYHAVYVDTANGVLYVDLTVEYALRDWEELRRDFLAYLNGIYPQYEINLTIETDFV